MKAMIEAVVRYEEGHGFFSPLHLLVADIATNSLLPRDRGRHRSARRIGYRQSRAGYRATGGRDPGRPRRGYPARSWPDNRTGYLTLPRHRRQSPALGLDKLDPVIKSLIQGVALAIEAEADGKAKLLKLPDSQLLAQTAGAGFGLLFGGHYFHNEPCCDGVECSGAAI